MAHFLIIIRFYFLRLAHFHQWTLVSLFIAGALLLTSMSTWFIAKRSNEDAQAQLKWVGRHAHRTLPTKPAPIGSESNEDALPSFNAGDFAGAFQHTAQDVGLVIEEIGYTLDDSVSQPYVRYRMNLSVQSDYPKIRNFLAAISAEFPYVSMDAIACSREKAGVQTVGCKLTLSAYFSKA